MTFLIKISSKDKKDLNLFLNFFSKFENIKIKNISNKKFKNFLSILKSPHINKSAQEQFEVKFYTKTLLIESLHYFGSVSLEWKCLNFLP